MKERFLSCFLTLQPFPQIDSKDNIISSLYRDLEEVERQFGYRLFRAYFFLIITDNKPFLEVISEM